MDGWMDHGSWMSSCRCGDVWNLDSLCYLLIPSYPLIGVGTHWDPKPEWVWVWDEFCTHDGYGDGYGNRSNMMGMGMWCYNPVGNSPLTSLVGRNGSIFLPYEYRSMLLAHCSAMSVIVVSEWGFRSYAANEFFMQCTFQLNIRGIYVCFFKSDNICTNFFTEPL
jgi:hypothetical protein